MIDTLDCDVLIVGGGPAGLSVASHLDPSVHSIILHQDAEIGRPVRTSGGTWERDMQALEIPKKHYQVIDQLDFFSDNAEARFAIANDRMAVLDVTGLYQYLASLSEYSNCNLLTGTKFVSVERQGDGFVSTARNREDGEFSINSNYVIDSSGWQSVVLESLGLGSKPNRTGVGIEYEFPRCSFPKNRAILFVGETALTGYGWVFPTPDNRLRLGIGVLHPDTDLSPRSVMDAFVAGGHAARYGVEILKDYKVNAGIIPSVAYDPELVFGNVIRVGDSANMASPTVGEGIRTAIEFGRLLGQELSNQINGDTRALQRYQATANKRFTRDYRFGLMMNQRIAQYSPNRWDKSVQRLARLSEVEMTAMVRSEFSVRMIVRTIWLNLKRKMGR
ncbi:MAG: NAD(P)/FAD-dependent oxidoreductase [Rhodobacteraceae bacterium]|nr:NAD(P)/FAD-dependent oxidoreductase [Paracoccaceae bacterium]